MSSHTRVVTVLALVLVVILAGCSGGGAGGGSANSGMSGANASGGSGGGAGAAAGSGSDGDGARTGDQRAFQTQQAIIKTGHVRLDVENFSTASQNLARATRRAGGYVSGSSQTTRSVNGENVTRGKLVLRVPSRNFSALLSNVEAAGTVRNSQTNAIDVTGKVVDLKARLNNSRAQRDRLRNLYANASNTRATLKVQKRLSGVQSRIERLQGQLKSLRDQIAYSTITVKLSESPPHSNVKQWYDVGVVDALVSSVGGVVTTLRAIVVAAAYLAPYLLVFGIPLGAVGYIAYRQRNN